MTPLDACAEELERREAMAWSGLIPVEPQTLRALVQERRLLVALEKASRECRGVWAALNDLDAFRCTVKGEPQ